MYKVYKTPKGYVAVSDEEINKVDWVYSPWALPKRCVFQVEAIKDHGYVDKNQYEHLKTYNGLSSKKIIAATFKLEEIPSFECQENRLMSIIKSLGYNDRHILTTDQEILDDFQRGLTSYEERHFDLLRRLHHYAFRNAKTVEEYKHNTELYDSLLMFISLGKKNEQISAIEFEEKTISLNYNKDGLEHISEFVIEKGKIKVKRIIYENNTYN